MTTARAFELAPAPFLGPFSVRDNPATAAVTESKNTVAHRPNIPGRTATEG